MPVAQNTLIAAWRAGSHWVECSLTPCLVTSPPGGVAALVNPANERLQGTLFTPSECSRRLPGGVAGIIYPPQVVDGLVSELGGAALAAACEALGGCETGAAVVTPATGELTACFSHVVHAVAPMYRDDGRWRSQLEGTYLAAFDAAAAAGLPSLGVPLLGAGARGAPVAAAAEAAAAAAAAWRGGAPLRRLHFGIQDEAIAESLARSLDRVLVRGSPGGVGAGG